MSVRRTGHPLYTVDGVTIADTNVTFSGESDDTAPVSVGSGGSALGYVVASAPSGGDDLAALNASVTTTPTGGTLFLPAGTYKISGPLIINKAIRVLGAGAIVLSGAQASGSGIPPAIGTPTVSPYVTGTVIEQQTAGQDIIQIPVIGLPVYLKGLGLRFATAIRFSNTGHGVNCLPSTAVGSGLENGLMNAQWEDVTVFGHDGNHYAFKITNGIYNGFRHLRSYGGGGLHLVNNGANGNHYYGNSLFDDFYFVPFMGGSAHAYRVQSVSGHHMFLVFNRIQAQQVGAYAAVYGASPVPTSAQRLFYADADTQYLWISGRDFESDVSGATSTYPTANFFLDPSGYDQGAFGAHRFLSPTTAPRRWLKTDLTTEVTVANQAALSDPALGIYDTDTGKVSQGYDPNYHYPYGGAITTIPRPGPAFARGAISYDGGAVAVSDGTQWSDIAAVSSLTALTDIAGLVLDADVHAAALSDGSLVATMTDASGAGNTLTASGAGRPTARNNPATPAGKRSLQFDGTANVMTCAASASMAAFTDFYYLYGDALDFASKRSIMASSAGGGIVTYLLGASGFKLGGALASGGSLGDATYAAPTKRWFLACVRFDGTTTTFRVDHSPVGTTTNAQTFTAGRTVRLGASIFDFYKGYIARAVRYSAALSDTEIKQVEKFLRGQLG